MSSGLLNVKYRSIDIAVIIAIKTAMSTPLFRLIGEISENSFLGGFVLLPKMPMFGSIRGMSKIKAFSRGVFSVWDFGFSRTRQEFLRKPDDTFDYRTERKRYGCDDNCWDSVGKYLRNAMSQYESEVGSEQIESAK